MTLLTDKQREEVAYIIARAYDKEDAAQRGESDPWAFSYAPALEAEWQAERLACAQSALTAALPAIERAVLERAARWHDAEAQKEKPLANTLEASCIRYHDHIRAASSIRALAGEVG